MRKITINMNTLDGMFLLASKDEARLVLTCLSVEVKGTEVVLCATDGKALAALRLRDDEVEYEGEDGKFVIPKPPAAMGKCERCTFEISEQEVRFSNGGLTIVERHYLDGLNYPNWRDVVPTGPVTPTGAFSFNPSLMDRVARCIRKIDKDSVGVVVRHHDNGLGCMSVIPGSGKLDFFAVVMPMRSNVEGIPAWGMKESEPPVMES